VTGEAMQGMLFGSLTSDSIPGQAAEHPAQLRLTALNVNSPGPQRAQQTLEWLVATGSNVMVLTEMRPSDGGRLIISGLDAENFDVRASAGWQNTQYFTLIASRGCDQHPLAHPLDPRVVAVELTSGAGNLCLIGLYGPTNGMTAESSDRRRAFQKEFLKFLRGFARPNMILAGDLNVVEPGHEPHLPSFQDHDYEFYDGLTGAGLADAFRALHPGRIAHSWLSDQYGAQRLDHIFVTPGAGTLLACDYDHEPRTRGITDHAAMHAILSLTRQS